MADVAFPVHTDFRDIPTARVYRAVLMNAETCGKIVALASAIGAVRATQSADPGLNRVLRVPVNGTSGNKRVVELRLQLLRHAFDIHTKACVLAQEAYGVQVARAPTWKPMPRASPYERLLANVTEWNARVKFNMNILKYTTEGGNVGTTLHRDESPLAYVIPLRRTNAVGGGTEYAHLPHNPDGVVLNPPAGHIVLHPGDAAHRGVPIEARDESLPGERWIVAGFLDTKDRHRPPRPDPPMGTRRGDVEALSRRWGYEDVLERGCHIDRSGIPKYRKRGGECTPLQLGKNKESVYLHTTSRSGRAYKYYVTPGCRRKRVLNKTLSILR